MSRFAQVPGRVFQDAKLTSSEKMTLSVLHLHINPKTGVCFPSIRRIARLGSLSERTVRRCVKRLEAKGYLEIQRRVTEDGDPASNLYRILKGYGQDDSTPCHGDSTSGHDDRGGTDMVSGGYCHSGRLTYNRTYKDEHKIQPDQNLLENPPLNSMVLKEDSIANTSSSKGVLNQNRKGKPGGQGAHEETVKKAFEIFWKCYPKRQGKAAAFKAFAEHFPEALPGDVLNSRLENLAGQALLYAEEVKDTEPRYVKNPANWIRSADPNEAAVIEVETWVREEEAPS